jgi:dCTP diphosphatase
MVPISAIRNRILRLTVITGTLSSLFLRTLPAKKSAVGPFVADTDMTTCMSQLLTAILELSSSLDINLHTACFEKIDKDCQTYPVDSCKFAGNFSEYYYSMESAGVADSTDDSTDPSWLDAFVIHSIPILIDISRQFAADRDLLQYHTPRNLLLSLTCELGYLAEVFQFKGDSDDQEMISVAEKLTIGHKIANVTMYLLRMADACNVSFQETKQTTNQVE